MVSRQPLTNFVLIADYDESLVHTFDDIESLKKLRIMEDPKKIDLRDRFYVLNIESSKGSGDERPLWGIKRPHLDIFIRFIFNYFKVNLSWSAGIYDYVHPITEEIFKNVQEPHAILTRSNCVGNQRIGFEKPIWKAMQDVPGLDKYVTKDNSSNRDNIKNVFIIDDRRSSFAQNPYNGILIPPYEPEATEEGLRKDDIALLQIMKWLMRPDVIASPDIRKLDKSNIFDIEVSPNEFRDI